MAQIVQLPDGSTASFPDEASVDQIKSALQKYAKPSPTPATDRATADTAKTSELAKIGTAVKQYVMEQIPTSLPQVEKMAGIPTNWTDPLQLAAFAAPVLRPMIDTGQGAVARAQQIQAAEQTPAWSQERWNAGIGTVLDIAQLAALARGGKFVAERGGEISSAKEPYRQTDQVFTEQGKPVVGAPEGEVQARDTREAPTQVQAQNAPNEGILAQMVPAVKSGDEPPIVGRQGQTHNDIIGEHPQSTELMAADPQRGFMVGDRFLNRKQAADLVGETEPLHSERLRELQKQLRELQQQQGGEVISEEGQKAGVPQQQATNVGQQPGVVQPGTGAPEGNQGRPVIGQDREINLGQGDKTGEQLGSDLNAPLKPEGGAAGEVKTPAISSLPTTGIKGNIYNAINQVRDRVTKALTRSQALTGYFQGMEKGARIGSETATAAAKENFNQAMRWHEADTNAVRESLLESVKQLPADQQGRFTSRITKVLNQPFDVKGGRQIKGEFVSNTERMWRAAGKVGDQIRRAQDEVVRKGLINDIQQTFEKSTASPSVDVGYKNMIRELFKGIQFKKPSAKTMQELLSRQEYMTRMEAQGKPHGLPAYAIDELVRLQQKPIAEMPVEQLGVLKDKMDNLVALGRVKRATREELWNNEREGLIGKLKNSVANMFQRKQKIVPEAIAVENDRTGRTLRNKITTIQNAASFIGQGLLPRDAAFEWADGSTGNYDGFMVKEFGGRIDLAFNDMSAKWNELSKRVNDAMQKHGIRPDSNSNGRIAVYANLQMEGGLERMIESGSATPETVASVQKSGLTPGEMEVYRTMMDTKEQLFPEVQKIMAHLYNIDVKKVNNHWSWYRDFDRFEAERPHKPALDPVTGEQYDERSAIDEFLFGYDPKYRTTSVEKGITKERQPGAETPITLDAHGTWEKMVKTMLFINHMQPELRLLGEVARRPEFKAKYGDMMQKYTLDWMDTVARAGKGVNMLPILDTLRKNVSAGIIGGRLGSQMKHMAFIPYAMYHSGGAKWYVRGLAAAHTPEGQAFIARNFAEITQRSSSHIGVAELGDKGMRALAKKALFFPVRAIDAENASATALGRYMFELENRGLNWKNFDTIPVDKSAQAQSLVRMRRAVASPIYKDVPLALSRGYGFSGSTSIARSVFQFGNPKLDQWSNIRVDLVGAAKRGEYGKAAKLAGAVTLGSAIEAGVVVGYNALRALAVGGLFQLFFGDTRKQQYAVKEDYPTDFAKDFAADLFFKLPLTNNMWTMAQYGESGIPLLDIAKSGAQHSKQAITGAGIPHVTQEGERKPTQLKPETRLRAGIRAAGELGSLTGVPGISQVADIGAQVVPRQQRTPRGGTRKTVGSFGGTQKKKNVAHF